MSSFDREKNKKPTCTCHLIFGGVKMKISWMAYQMVCLSFTQFPPTSGLTFFLVGLLAALFFGKTFAWCTSNSHSFYACGTCSWILPFYIIYLTEEIFLLLFVVTFSHNVELVAPLRFNAFFTSHCFVEVISRL